MRIETDQLKTIHEAIYQTYLMDLVQTYLRKVTAEASPLRKLYILMTQHTLNLVHADLVQNKKKLQAAGIRYESLDGNENNALYFQMFHRGLGERFSIYREQAKSQMEIRLTEYVETVMSDLLRIPEKHRKNVYSQ